MLKSLFPPFNWSPSLSVTLFLDRLPPPLQRGTRLSFCSGYMPWQR